MQTIIATTALFAIAMAALGTGLMLGRAPIRGSCGGIACGGACEGCGRKRKGEPR